MSRSIHGTAVQVVGKPLANLTLVVYFLLKGYHEFKIKGPEGTPFHVLPENGSKDPFALRCVLPEIREIPETRLDVPQSGIKER